MNYQIFVILLLSFNVILGINSAIISSNDDNANNIARGIDAKGMLSTLASNLMGRGYITTGTGTTGSQVVSLNLTNLFVLVLLKALIFAAGSLGAGTWKGGLGRSNDGEETILTDDEVLLFLSYLTGDHGCLQNIACQQPQQAKKYVAAGDMLLKATRVLSPEVDGGYQQILDQLDRASNVGLAHGNCEVFQCSSNDDKQ